MAVPGITSGTVVSGPTLPESIEVLVATVAVGVQNSYQSFRIPISNSYQLSVGG